MEKKRTLEEKRGQEYGPDEVERDGSIMENLMNKKENFIAKI